MSHILVVEDDADIASLIAHYLEKAGHRVDKLASGSDVLPRLRKVPADLVILDLMLPGIDGLVVCQAMRADQATAQIPIIMLTARGDESDRVSGLELGADDYVTKPFSPKELNARVTAPAAPRGSHGAEHAAALRLDYDRRRSAPGRPRRAGCPAHRQGVPAAAVPGAAQGACAVSRSAAQRRLGLSLHRRHSDRGRAHSPSSRKAATALGRDRDHQAVRLQTDRHAVTFRTRLFLAALVTAALALLVCHGAHFSSRTTSRDRAPRTFARQPGTTGRRHAVAPSGCGRRRARRRGGRARRPRRRARDHRRARWRRPR